MNAKAQNFVNEVAEHPVAHFNAGGKFFLIQAEDGAWIPQTEAQLKRLGRCYGLETTTPRGSTVSELDRFIIDTQLKNNVAFAGPLAGHEAGVVQIEGRRILVTESPRIIAAVPGEWDTLHTVLLGMLGAVQLQYVMGWIKVAYEALIAHKRVPGQALAIAGARDCGKSLFQALLTLILGGRAARPYGFMNGTTPFNAHLFGAEHLMVEDEAPSTDLRSRREFGANLKSITVNLEQQCHAKGQTPLMLRPFWRMSITLNDEPENLMVLPPIDESIHDKIILLRATAQTMPMPTGTMDQREAFWNQLVSELPGFLHYLTTWTIPPEMRSQRFGVTHYHHPDLLDALAELAPEHRLLSLIDGYLFNGSTHWTGTSEELERSLTGAHSDCRHEAARLFTYNSACGTYLSRLAKRQPLRVKSERTHASRVWIIRREETGRE